MSEAAIAAQTSLLEVKNIETYYGAVMALRGVSMAAQEGKISTILGANGAGKTTLLKTISGVLACLTTALNSYPDGSKTPFRTRQ